MRGSHPLIRRNPDTLVTPASRNRSLICQATHTLRGHHVRSQSHYRWVIVAAGGLLGCVAIGAMFSLPVFLRPIAQDTGWSVTGVSSAMTIAFVAMALGSIAWGSLSDRFGPRVVVLAGSVLLAVEPGARQPDAHRSSRSSSSSACWSAAAPRRSSPR